MARILVVDDAVDAAEALALLFQACGHEAHVAFDGQEGVAAARRHDPQIIFLDLDMPVLDGFGAARALRAWPATHGAFIVALTANSDADVQARTAEAGFDFYLHKPANTNTLLALIDDLDKRTNQTARRA